MRLRRVNTMSPATSRWDFCARRGLLVRRNAPETHLRSGTGSKGSRCEGFAPRSILIFRSVKAISWVMPRSAAQIDLTAAEESILMKPSGASWRRSIRSRRTALRNGTVRCRHKHCAMSANITSGESFADPVGAPRQIPSSARTPPAWWTCI